MGISSLQKTKKTQNKKKKPPLKSNVSPILNGIFDNQKIIGHSTGKCPED